MKKYIGFFIAITAAVTAIPAFAEESSENTAQAVVEPDGTQRLQILGGNYFFKPDHIIVKVNVPVELSVARESGIVPHTFVMKIPEMGIAIDEDLDVKPKTIAFTPTSTGKYTFYCRNKLLFFKSHQQKGMKGVLEVVP